MKFKGIIFDLDQTLVDSKVAELNRKNRNWSLVYEQIPSFGLYEGFDEVFRAIRANRIKVSIITNSPGTYAKKVVSHFSIPCDVLVDYFSVRNRKPHPESFHLATNYLGIPSVEIVSFGDRGIDISASKSAGIIAGACLWDTNEKQELLSLNPDFILHSPSEILTIIS